MKTPSFRWIGFGILSLTLCHGTENVRAGSAFEAEAARHTARSEASKAEERDAAKAKARGEIKPELKPELKTEGKSEAEAKTFKAPHRALNPLTEAYAQRGACLADSTAIEDIRKSKEEIEVRRKELAAKESEIKAREQALNEEIKKLLKARDELLASQDIKKKVDEERLNKLVETLLTMSPKASSRLLSAVDEELAVAAIYRMDTVRLGKILNVMDTPISSRLSEQMVGLVKRQKLAQAKLEVARESNLTSEKPVDKIPERFTEKPAEKQNEKLPEKITEKFPEKSPEKSTERSREARLEPQKEKGGEKQNDRKNEPASGANTAELQQPSTRRPPSSSPATTIATQ